MIFLFMSLTSQIQTIIQSLQPDATYKLASSFNANINSYSIENNKFPLIVLMNELTKNCEIKKNNNIIKSTRVVIAFLDKDKRDKSDEEREAIRLSMEQIADRVAVNIYQLDEVRTINNANQPYTLTPLFHMYNSDLTGVELEMNINYNETTSFCSS